MDNDTITPGAGRAAAIAAERAALVQAKTAYDVWIAALQTAYDTLSYEKEEAAPPSPAAAFLAGSINSAAQMFGNPYPNLLAQYTASS